MACSIRRGLLLAEVTVCLATAVAFGYAYPDRYRTRLWENGGAEGWNSSPGLEVEVPLIWSQRLTDSNLAKAILSTTVYVVRIATSRLGSPFPCISTLYSLLLCILWATSLQDQISPDYSDAQHPSSRPWYLTRSCLKAQKETRFACHAAQLSFFITTAAVSFYCVRTLLDLAEAARVWATTRRLQREEELQARTIGDYPDKESYRNYEHYEHDSAYARDPNDKTPAGGRGAVDIINEAWSPVLAFYPADVR